MARKILVVGTGPLLEKGTSVMSGQCLRTWHFCKPLLGDGHAVRLLTIPIPGTTSEGLSATIEEATYEGFSYTKFSTNDKARLVPEITAAISKFTPDAIVGVNAYPAYLLAEASLALRDRQVAPPFWADLNGWTMAEGLIRGKVVGHDRDYTHFWRMEALTILAADRFSTVTTRQGFALLGELAMMGRANSHCSSLVTTVPNAVYPDYATLHRCVGVPEFLRENLPPDSLIALWTGGFNSWTDVATLVAGMKTALSSAPRLAFVCTGGAVHGHDEKTYADFLALAKEQLPANRFLPLGWIDFERVRELHQCAHVGMNLDGDNIETLFGARNRITNLLGAGVPVITTHGTEIADWIVTHAAGSVISQRNPADLAATLLDSVNNSPQWETRAAAARARALAEFAPAHTLSEFLAWCENPRHTPFIEDAQVSILRRKIEQLALQPGAFSGPDATRQPDKADAADVSPVAKIIRLLKGFVRD